MGRSRVHSKALLAVAVPVMLAPAISRESYAQFQNTPALFSGHATPGRDDVFVLRLNGDLAAQGFLQGGNIQLHTRK
jgi:hypothetical protein